MTTSEQKWKRYYSKQLRLREPWEVESYLPVDEEDEDTDVVVRVKVPMGILMPCPGCGTMCRIHDRKERRWRDKDVGDSRCFIECDVPRTDCPKCGVLTVNVPWARPQVRYSRRFEEKVLSLAEKETVSDVARELRVHRSVVDACIHNRVRDILDGLDLSGLKRIHIDETSVRRGHNYVTIISDADRKRIVFICEGRDVEALVKFRDWLISHKGSPENILTVNMDMSKSYQLGVRENLPNAVIVFDRFHVVQMANTILDRIRAKEQVNGQRFKYIRYTLLKKQSNMDEEQLEKLFRIKEDNKVLGLAYEMKESIIQLYDYPDKISAGMHISRWFDWVLESGHKEMRRLAKSVHNNLDGILSWFDSRTSNAFQEGLNSMIQTSKRMARGFANVSNFIDVVWFKHSNIPI